MSCLPLGFLHTGKLKCIYINSHTLSDTSWKEKYFNHSKISQILSPSQILGSGIWFSYIVGLVAFLNMVWGSFSSLWYLMGRVGQEFGEIDWGGGFAVTSMLSKSLPISGHCFSVSALSRMPYMDRCAGKVISWKNIFWHKERHKIDWRIHS